MNLQDVYVRRMDALKRAEKNAQNPEFKKLWNRKLKQLIRTNKPKLVDLH